MSDDELLKICKTPTTELSNQVKLAQIKILVEEKNANINTKGVEDGYTPLMELAAFDDLESVQYLVNKGADLFYTNDNGDNALESALANNDSPRISHYLAIEMMKRECIDVSQDEVPEITQYKISSILLHLRQQDPASPGIKKYERYLFSFGQSDDTDLDRMILLGTNIKDKSSHYYKPTNFILKKEKNEEKKLQNSFEIDADDSSDEEENEAIAQYLNPTLEHNELMPSLPLEFQDDDPQGYSCLAHIVGTQKLHTQLINKAYYKLKRGLPPSKIIASPVVMSVIVKNTLLDLIKKTFLAGEHQQTLKSEIYNKFISENDAWIQTVSASFVSNPRDVTKQIYNKEIQAKYAFLIFNIRKRIRNYIYEFNIEEKKIESASDFVRADFRLNLYNLIKKICQKYNLLQATGNRFVGGLRVDLQSEDKIENNILFHYRTMDGRTTLSTAMPTLELETYELLLVTEGNKNAGIITKEGGVHYYFKSNVTQNDIKTNSLNVLFEGSEDLYKKYLPYTAARIKEELLSAVKLLFTPFAFTKAIQNAKNKIKLARGLPPEQYQFKSANYIEFYANIRLSMRIQKRRIRQAMQDNEAEVIDEASYQAAWQFGDMPCSALEQQKISSNGARTDLVINLGSYKQIADDLDQYKAYGKHIAKWMLEGKLFHFDQLNAAMNAANIDFKMQVKLNRFLPNLAYLLLGCEIQRNPASLVTHLLALELLAVDDKFTWSNALANPSLVNKCAGGEIPMSMGKYVDKMKIKANQEDKESTTESSPVKCARLLQTKYGLFAVKSWEYHGEQANEKSEKEMGHVKELVRRENAIIGRWLKFKGLDALPIENRIKALDDVVTRFLK